MELDEIRVWNEVEKLVHNLDVVLRFVKVWHEELERSRWNIGPSVEEYCLEKGGQHKD